MPLPPCPTALFCPASVVVPPDKPVRSREFERPLAEEPAAFAGAGVANGGCGRDRIAVCRLAGKNTMTAAINTTSVVPVSAMIPGRQRRLPMASPASAASAGIEATGGAAIGEEKSFPALSDAVSAVAGAWGDGARSDAS